MVGCEVYLVMSGGVPFNSDKFWCSDKGKVCEALLYRVSYVVWVEINHPHGSSIVFKDERLQQALVLRL